MFSDSRVPIEEWAKRFPGAKPASPTMTPGGAVAVQGADARIEILACAPN